MQLLFPMNPNLTKWSVLNMLILKLNVILREMNRDEKKKRWNCQQHRKLTFPSLTWWIFDVKMPNQKFS